MDNKEYLYKFIYVVYFKTGSNDDIYTKTALENWICISCDNYIIKIECIEKDDLFDYNYTIIEKKLISCYGILALEIKNNNQIKTYQFIDIIYFGKPVIKIGIYKSKEYEHIYLKQSDCIIFKKSITLNEKIDIKELKIIIMNESDQDFRLTNIVYNIYGTTINIPARILCPKDNLFFNYQQAIQLAVDNNLQHSIPELTNNIVSKILSGNDYSVEATFVYTMIFSGILESINKNKIINSNLQLLNKVA